MRRIYPLAHWLLTSGFGLALALLAAGVAAQVPDEFTNLQFLPKEIPQGELLDIMKGFALGLDVRCEYCHRGEPGQPLSSFDFAVDEKEAKRTARIMLTITHDLNERIPEALARDPAEVVQVTCVTCHRGQAKPRLILDIMDEKMAAGGIEKALDSYRSLREQSYGTGTYDFAEWTLQQWATELAQVGQSADALAVLAMAEEYFPDSIRVQVLIGEVHLIGGDREQAIAQFRRVLELDPENRVATMRLTTLVGGAEE